MRMKHAVISVALVWIAGASGVATEGQYASRRTPDKNAPTFSKDVAPIIFKNCAGCHRPGEIAPMSLLTYEDARPWAKAIRDEVGDRRMPPWHADAPAGTFHNERLLSDADCSHVYRPAKQNGVYAFLLEGDVEIADAILTRRDSLALEGEDKVEIKVRTDGTDMLLVETKL